MGKQGAVLYARVSTAEQASQNNSLPVQQKKFHDYCTINALEVLNTFIDKQSARTANDRRQFQAMLDYCHRHKKQVSCVVVADFSRFARNVLDQASAIATLKQLGIDRVSIDEPITDESAAGKLARNMLASMNQFFSDSLSEKTKYRMAAGVKAGRWLWVAPLGYLNDKTTKQIVIDPQRAALIRKAFELIVSRDYQSAFRLVTSMGLTTRSGRDVPKQTFSRLVRNPFYCGWIQSNGTRVKGAHEPLISEELFESVQEKLTGKAAHNKNHEDFPLRGFLGCAFCRKLLTAGWVTGRNGKKYAHYWCWTKGCETRASKEYLEENFCTLLSVIQPSADVLAKLPLIAARTWETRKGQIAEDSKMLARRLEEQRSLNLRTIKATLNGELSEEDFQLMKESIAEEIKRIKTAIAALDAEKASYTEVMQETEHEALDFKAAWLEGNIHRKRELQNALFPEGLMWWVKRGVFETANGLSIDELWEKIAEACLVGVPDGI